jgi:hypothetical protein
MQARALAGYLSLSLPVLYNYHENLLRGVPSGFYPKGVPTTGEVYNPKDPVWLGRCRARPTMHNVEGLNGDSRDWRAFLIENKTLYPPRVSLREFHRLQNSGTQHDQKSELQIFETAYA